MDRGKTFANAFEKLTSSSRMDSSASFDAVVPKAVEKVVVQMQKDPKPTAVQTWSGTMLLYVAIEKAKLKILWWKPIEGSSLFF